MKKFIPFILLVAFCNRMEAGGCCDSSLKPGPHNTGPSDTTNLTPIESMTITVDGTILENFTLSGSIKVEANNVTIRNFKITTDAYYAINCSFGYTGTLIEDGEIVGAKSAGIMGKEFTARRIEIHECYGDAMKAQGSNVLVEYCYFHHIGKKEGSHADGNQTRAGSNLIFRYNNIYMPINGSPNGPGLPYKSNATLMFQTGSGPISDVTFDGNWLNGGNYTIYMRDKGVGHGNPENVTIINNCFGRDYNFGVLSNHSPNPIIYGNKWEDDCSLMDINNTSSPNQNPIAILKSNLTSGTAPLTVHFDGSTSTDTDGSLVSYSWNFGDDNNASGDTISHTFTNEGMYVVQLTVTDDDGAIGVDWDTINVTAPTANLSPTAIIVSDVVSGLAPLEVHFDGRTSFDPDGSLVSHSWDFGDGSNGFGDTINHTFTTNGIYVVELSVTDDDGLVDKTSFLISVGTQNCQIDSITDVIEACDSYRWVNGVTYFENNNNAIHVLVDSGGCYSFIHLDLTIHNIDSTVTQDGNILLANSPEATYQWINCNNNHEIIPGEKDRDYTPQTTGSYAVEITEGECSVTSSCYEVIVTDIVQDNFNRNIMVYPNPTNGNLHVILNSTHKNVDITLRNALGQIVLVEEATSSNHIQLTMNVEEGIYFIEIRTDKEDVMYYKLFKSG